MLNPIAEKLIHNLRYDELTREHYAITSWTGKGTCGSIGCIAGTALALHHKFDPKIDMSQQLSGLKLSGGVLNYKEAGSRVLGINENLGRQLFLPVGRWLYPLTQSRMLGILPKFIDDLGHNQRPSEDTIQEWQEFAGWVRNDCNGPLLRDLFNADASANALEQVTLHEMPYVDWLRACREAETV